MRLQNSTIAVIGLSAAAVAAVPVASGSGCQGPVIFTIRGTDYDSTTLTTDPNYTDMPAGYAYIVNAIQAKHKNAFSSAIPYPAINFADVGATEYHQSVAIGAETLKNAITSYTKTCYDQQVFVIGHSQGGTVVSAALGGYNGIAAYSNSQSK